MKLMRPIIGALGALGLGCAFYGVNRASHYSNAYQQHPAHEYHQSLVRDEQKLAQFRELGMVVRANFKEIPFHEKTFDAAYAQMEKTQQTRISLEEANPDLMELERKKDYWTERSPWFGLGIFGAIPLAFSLASKKRKEN